MPVNLDPEAYPRLEDTDVAGKLVLVRVDYNVGAGTVDGLADDYRLNVSLPTLEYLRKAGARTLLLTHRGRPKGEVRPELTTAPLAHALGLRLGQTVAHAADCVGRVAEEAARALEPGQFLMLENTRFHLGEQLNQQPFVQKLMQLGAEVFVNEAFPALHRAHASLSGLAAQMPVSVLGCRVQAELAWMNTLLDNAPKPLLVMLGGANIGHKLEMLHRLMGRVDQLMIGGAIGQTLLAARDVNLGLSQYEPSFLEPARDFLAEAGVLGCRILLPTDLWVAKREKPDEPWDTRVPGRLAPDEMGRDLGPLTLAAWKKVIGEAGTVFWLGSMGATEKATFATGTHQLAEAVCASNAFSFVGGDGLLKTLRHDGLRDKLPRVTSGNGVVMAALAGQPLPALQVLQARQQGNWTGERRSATA